MPFVAALWGALIPIMASLTGRVLLALGIGFVTYKGMDLSAAFLLQQVKTSLAGMPAEVLSFLGYCWIDKAIGMIFSAWTAGMAIKGLAGGITRMKIR